MIEIIQQKETTEEKFEGRLPKNIRQIGNPEKDFRIYMEDYVYTYLHPAQIQGMEIGVYPRLLILLGEIEHFANRSCAFISGAVQVDNRDFSKGIPELTEDAWREIHMQILKYFEKSEIVGWVLDIPGHSLHITEEIEQMHKKNFIGTFQFFFLMDSQEREEAFYTWKQGKLTRKEVYFIYYEKNPQMQEYMISRRENRVDNMIMPEIVQDRAAKSYRALMLEKKETTMKRRTGFLSYLTSLLMVITLCVVSVILLGSIQRMHQMEQTISVMAAVEEEKIEEPIEEPIKEKYVDVEIIRGEIIPALEEAEKKEVKATEKTPVEVQPETKANVYLEQGYYIVESGDSLQNICFKIYQTDAILDELCELNGITDQNSILVGQKLTLP